MKTPLDIWQKNPDYQQVAQDFFQSDAGYMFILAMQQKNLPYRNNLSHDELKGFQRFIDEIPNLFRTAFAKLETQSEAVERLKNSNQLRNPQNNS